MKKTARILIAFFLFVGICYHQVDAQSFIKKLKDKTEDAAIDEMFKGQGKSKEASSKSESSEENSSISNSKGGGLSSTKPDVMANINAAGSAFGDKNYSDARNSSRLAIQGIELEIGENILTGLPSSIHGLEALPEEDQVTSSGIGFVGLVIQRTYRGGDQEFRVTIGNDAALISAAGMYLASGAYATSSEEQNYKQTKFKEQRAVIEYDESAGYKLSVPFGQSSILLTEGVNFSTEEEFMGASEEINLENIKNQLGEK
jgi:hypothetical protein